MCVVPPRQEGRTRRHEREAGCDGRERVVRRTTARSDGEGVQARRPSGRCQVSWVDIPRGDGDNKAWSLRGEHANKPLTPLAQGMPVQRLDLW